MKVKPHYQSLPIYSHSTKKPVTTMLTYPWKCTVLHCNHLGNTWKSLVLMTRHFDYCPSASGCNVKLYISRGRLAWWLLAFLHSEFLQSTGIFDHKTRCRWCSGEQPCLSHWRLADVKARVRHTCSSDSCLEWRSTPTIILHTAHSATCDCRTNLNHIALDSIFIFPKSMDYPDEKKNNTKS